MVVYFRSIFVKMPEDQKLNRQVATKNGGVDVVDLIRTLRNDLIKDFLDERFLLEYLQNQYNQIELSRVKLEFIKKDLKQLLISPVDLEHYKPIIDDFNTNESFSLSEGNEVHFYREIEKILKRFLFT